MISYDDLIGTPFEYGGRGPDSYDCFGLVSEIYRRKGIKVPEIRSTADYNEQASRFAIGVFDWVEVEKKPGVVVLFRIGGVIRHCGIVLELGKFLHTWEGTNGVTIDRLDEWKYRIAGYYDYK